MAKITARGDRETHRWTDGDRTLVLTKRGRLLYKFAKHANYTLSGDAGTALATAEAKARELGLEPTTVRR